MPRYFFDLQIGDASEPDIVGSELASSAMITDMALDLCVQLARERMPDGSSILVSVRSADGPTIYQAKITLSGDWT